MCQKPFQARITVVIQSHCPLSQGWIQYERQIKQVRHIKSAKKNKGKQVNELRSVPERSQKQPL